MLNYKLMMDQQKLIESRKAVNIISVIKKILTAIEEGHKRSNINDKQISESKCGII